MAYRCYGGGAYGENGFKVEVLMVIKVEVFMVEFTGLSTRIKWSY